MSLVDAAGFLAGLFVILAFYSTNAATLRGFAIGSNLLFVVYAVERDLAPIAILHLILLPLNVWRLRQTLGGRWWRTGVTPPPRARSAI